MVVGLGSGEIMEEGLTRWIRDNWPARTAGPRNPPAKPQSSPRMTTKPVAKKGKGPARQRGPSRNI